MGRLDRYIFSITATAFLSVVVVLAGMIWSTQALRQLDLVTNQGQTVLAFVAITGLTLPMLVQVIAPAALFIATVYALLKLNGDSEIVVMASAGMGPWRVIRPMIILSLLVAAFCSVLAISIVPTSLRMFREQVTQVRADVVSFIAQPGRFVNLSQGMVFHVRERDQNGTMRGILINDARDNNVSTYLADRGNIVDTDAGTFLILEDGSIHRRGAAKDNGTSVVEFKRYAFDLSSLAPESQNDIQLPAERPLSYVRKPPPNDFFQFSQPGRYREELHKRLSAGLYPLAYFAIAAAALARPRTTRQSRGLALVAIIPAMAFVQIGNFAIAGQLRAHAAAVPLIYLLPIVTIIICALVLQGWLRLSAPKWLVTAAETLRQRLTRPPAARPS